jgi:hypothetical protein
MALAALALLAGCGRPSTEEGGGGGPAPTPNIQQTQERLGEAFVQAARVHAGAVRGDYRAAGVAIRKARAELSQAKHSARLDTQARINDLDQLAIQVERELGRRSSSSYQTTEVFVDRMQRLIGSVPPLPGAGASGVDRPPSAPPTPQLP